MSAYDVNSTNTSRLVRFRIQPTHATDTVANVFLALKGPEYQRPFYGRIVGTPTAAQNLAQLRLSWVVRAISVYAPPILVQVVNNTDGETNGAIIVGFETDQSGVFFRNAYATGNASGDKHQVTDITDTVGVVGTAKTKPGIQSLLDSLATVSYDGGTTGPFGVLSASGNIVLPDGSITAGAPILSTPGSGSGLTAVWLV